MAKQLNKPNPPKRRRSNRSAAYWTVFAICALASFGGGFWFTYRGTQVSIKEPPVGPAASALPVAQATPLPAAAASDSTQTGPLETPAPVDPFAASDPTPAPAGKTAQATPVPGDGDMPSDEGGAPAAAPTDVPSETAASNPTAQDSNKVFRVQVGNYDSQAAAQSMVDELSAAGIKAVIVQDATGQYHAQIGAYAKRDRALAVADEVNAKGYSVTIRQ